MLRTRLIPCLQLRKGSLVKTRQFGKFTYIGDPANTCRIFNECEVDELVVIDIHASIDGRGPDFKLLEELAEECFMPVAYGGGITNVGEAEKVLRLGMEKIIIGTASHTTPELFTEIARAFGTQCVIAAIDVKSGLLSERTCRTHSGRKSTGVEPVEWARNVEQLGAGEILLTSINKEGTWGGFDLDLIQSVSDAVSIPVIAHGGAGSHDDIRQAVTRGASAVALGNMVVFQKKDMGVLVNFPSEAEREAMGLHPTLVTDGETFTPQ